MSANSLPIHRRRRPRAPWLSAVLALTAALGLILPAAASAGARRGAEGAGEAAARGGRCRIEANVAPGELTAGESATVAGSLACPVTADAAGRTITVYQHLAGTPGSSAVGSTTTEADGSFRLTTEPLEADSSFYADSEGARRSPSATVEVSPLLTISGPPAGTQLLIAGRGAGASAHAGNTVTFSGTVSPDDTGARVVLQRESATAEEDWREIGLGEVGADGAYSITHTFLRPGDATIRVVVRPRGLRASASEPLSYEIAQRQNPRLTIQASSDPLPYGQGVTLSGTAAGAAGQRLTLLARERSGGFAPVATVTTDESGGYVFAAQSPLQSTYYKVTSAHTSSTTLFEGVTPLLTAQLSSPPASPAPADVSTAQAGQPLVFSGTITPGRTGQVIYLERHNPSGIGFHIVASATVGAGSAYSIEHTISGSGTQVFRIKVPHDDESQATASQLFEIQVTPATATSPQALGTGSTPAGES